MNSRAPGVYKLPWIEEPLRNRRLRTGVPGFLGFYQVEEDSEPVEIESPRVTQQNLTPYKLYGKVLMSVGTPFSPEGAVIRTPTLQQDDLPLDAPSRFSRWSQFAETLAKYPEFTAGYTGHAVKGFFANGGRLCYVFMVGCTLAEGPTVEKISTALEAFSLIEDIDLICVPDLMWPQWWKDKADAHASIQALQATVLHYCEQQGDCFAILDSWQGADEEGIIKQRLALPSNNGALYYPWLKTIDGPPDSDGFIPPSGQVAAIYAKSDEAVRGVHKAPANEVLIDVVDLERTIDSIEQAELNLLGVNCIRTFTGRGIRVWGARTLANPNSEWSFVNVRRIFLMTARWIDHHMSAYLFEPNTQDLWERIRRDLTHYCTELLQVGALQGATPEQAFRVKCDAETNPREVIDRGQVVAEIGLAPTIPSEFIIVRIIQRPDGSTMIEQPNP